jgi:hypothetical protein
MKYYLTLIAIFSTLYAYAFEKKDSTQAQIKVSGNVLVTNNGISPVPAFSLGKPAIMTAFLINKGNFSFNPQFNYGIDGKPWSSNNWLRWQFPIKKFTFRTGVNWSLFFKQATVTENGETFTVKRVNRYFETELAAFYQINNKTLVQTMFWHDEGMDVDAVKRGSFFSLMATFSKIPLSKSVKMTLIPHVFYLDNKIPFRGYFTSGTAIFSYKNSPFSISVQGVKPIWVKPEASSSWNVGLNWSF